MSYHYMPIPMLHIHIVNIMKSLYNFLKLVFYGKHVRKIESCLLLVDMWDGAVLYKTACHFLKNLKSGLPWDPEIAVLGINTNELKAGIQTKYL